MKHTRSELMRLATLTVAAAALVVAAASCGSPENQTRSASEQPETALASDLQRAVAVLTPTEGNQVQGTVTFTATDDGVSVVADLSGLEPGSTHGFHVHEYGDVTAADGTAAGGHYDPAGHAHALPDERPRHAGDLGNVQADAEGRVRHEIVVDNITVAGPTNPVLGRAVIVHAQADDGGQPTGNAGARMAQGVIGVAGPEGAGS